ncbi:hypothetical protein J6590_001757 [Homalodisca vitripennis]|nr:hypothetical protein J6590_001757 [Homalodisca vitripennis]
MKRRTIIALNIAYVEMKLHAKVRYRHIWNQRLNSIAHFNLLDGALQISMALYPFYVRTGVSSVSTESLVTSPDSNTESRRDDEGAEYSRPRSQVKGHSPHDKSHSHVNFTTRYHVKKSTPKVEYDCAFRNGG